MPPPLPLRIAILECDTPFPNTNAKYGGYKGVFTTLLHAAAAALSLPSTSLSITAYDVVTAQDYPSLSSVDAVLMTGSKYTSFDSDPWIIKLVAFTRLILAQSRVRLIGVCFGHQIIARAMDAPLGRSDAGWEVSVTPMALTPVGREIFRTEDGTLRIQQMHRDVVFEHPAGTQPLAHTDKCEVQGIYIPRRMIAVQGHPEYTGEMVREILEARYKMGIFDRVTFEDAMARVDNGQDGVLIAQAFLKFLLEE